MADDVKITIKGDSDPFIAALKEAEAGAKQLESTLKTVAQVSAVAFAALTAEAYVALKAFEESDKASRALTQSLQNQGIYSQALAEDYKAQADELSRLTGVDDDAIIKGQALAQSFLGQQKQTKEFNQAVLDLSAGLQVDVQTAYEMVSKSIGTNTNALARNGFVLDDNASKQDKTAALLKQIEGRYGGMAVAANQGLGSINGLTNAFENLQEEIGARLIPVVVPLIKHMTDLINWFQKNKAIMDWVVSIGLTVGAVTGLITAIGAGVLAFAKIQAAITAVTAAAGALGIGIGTLVGATGIGLLLIVAAQVYMNWSTIWPAMQAVFQGFVDNITPLLKGLGYLLAGVFMLRIDMIKDGFNQVKEAMSNMVDDVSANHQRMTDAAKSSAETQKADLKALADQTNAEQEANQALRRESQRLHLEAMKLERENHSQQLIELTRQESEILKQIADEKDLKEREALTLQREQIRLQKADAQALDDEQQAVFEQQMLANNEAYQALNDQQKAKFRASNQAQLAAQIQTTETTKAAAAQRELQADIQRRNQFLEDERKFGKEYAYINQVMNSSVYQGSKKAFGELEQLQSSSNSTLKSIGKVAAVANISIKTAESAMNIYTGFSTIPIVGPALGLAGAIAAVAFGAEQIGKVNSAASGALVEGGIRGKDSVPFMLEPGELVVPRRNFSEVVNAVASQRANNPEDYDASYGGSRGGGQMAIMIGFDGSEAEQVLTAKQVEARYLGTIREREVSA